MEARNLIEHLRDENHKIPAVSSVTPRIAPGKSNQYTKGANSEKSGINQFAL